MDLLGWLLRSKLSLLKWLALPWSWVHPATNVVGDRSPEASIDRRRCYSRLYDRHRH